ncbi:uncharacterized protein LOC143297722 [Babylonia areolata]|uniref:uncharacterized protein LOC143297722 n=1 Tax=Babylonia areolata TaxID=304850 RepID=UPI003FD0202E
MTTMMPEDAYNTHHHHHLLPPGHDKIDNDNTSSKQPTDSGHILDDGHRTITGTEGRGETEVDDTSSTTAPGEDPGDLLLPKDACRSSRDVVDCPGSVPGSGPEASSKDMAPEEPTTTTTRKRGSERIDTALNTLKSELMAMREQDLQLLKQLIHINDNIRRLKRARWLQRGGRTVSCGLLGARNPTPTPLPPGGVAVAAGSAHGAQGVQGVGGDRASVLLLRQRSEPGLLVGIPRRKVSSALTSTSSFETIEDLEDEEVDSLYGSSSDLPSDSSPLASPFTPSPKHSTPTTPTIRSTAATAYTYTSLTFTQEELWRGESSYGEILKRNIRLWKWSVARERESGVVTQGHPCVL